MIANNFKYPKGFEPSDEMPGMDEDSGPEIEDVGSSDLD